MGKIEEQTRQRQRYDEEQAQQNHSSSSEFLCHRCPVVFERFLKDLSFKCVFVLILSFAILVYGIFSIAPSRHNKSGFDAQQAIKLSASAQAYFILEKPVSELIPHIGRLEYDINEEIGVPNTKVTVLSMHRSTAPNRTAVVFGAVPDPENAPISPMSSSLMRSSLIEVFMKQTNFTLTTAIFGQPSKFEILKFQGGITVIPEYAAIWLIPQILFNFTLNSSISEILENIIELKDQLKVGLQLRTNENVFVQISNGVGSTMAGPITVQASIVSEFGNLQLQRLRQLAETLTGSPARNLGLDNAVLGKVNSISLSAYLRSSLSSIPPSPSPAPAPTHARAPVPASSENPELPPQSCPYFSSEILPSPSPTPSSNPTAPSALARASSPSESKGNTPGSGSSSSSPAPSPSEAVSLYNTLGSLRFSALFIFHLLCRPN